MRILHLIDPGSPGGGAFTLRRLAGVVARGEQDEHQIVLIGHAGHEALARRCGVRPAAVLPATMRQAWLSRRALARVIRELEEAGGRFDVVHAWTLACAALARLAAARRPRVACLSIGPVLEPPAWLPLRLLGRDRGRVLVPSRAVEREMVSVGIDASRLEVLAPGVDPLAPDATVRDRWRERWGVDEQTTVVGLVSEPVGWADAVAATNVVARLEVTGRPARLVLHRHAAGRARALSWARRLGYGDLMILEDSVAEPWAMLAGLDVALVTGDEAGVSERRAARSRRPAPGVMPMLWSLAAGIPVVAERTAVAEEALGEDARRMIVDRHDLNGACRRIIELHDDRQRARALGDAGRSRVASVFSPEAFGAGLEAVWSAAR